MAQLSTIRTNVGNNLPSNYFSSFLDDDQKDIYINDVQRWVCSGSLYMPDGKHIIHNFTWLKREVTASTVDQQRRYALPNNSNGGDYFRSEITLDLIDANSYRKELVRRLKRDIEHDPDYRDTTAKGTPKCYCVDDWDIWLYPLPDHTQNSNTAWTMNFEYYCYMDDLSGDTDTNQITNRWPEVLEYGATELCFRYGKDPEQAAYWEAKKIDKFLEMIKVDQQHEFSSLEEEMQPLAGFGMGEGGPGCPDFYYTQDTPYT